MIGFRNSGTFLIILMLVALSGVSQKNKKILIDTFPLPSWITMMYDPGVNYYNAIKTFNDYWKDKQRPVDEDELFESVGDKEKSERIKEKKERQKNNSPSLKYAAEYRTFLYWRRQYAGLVKPDGHIKNMDERLSEWQQQQALKKKQELKIKNQSTDNKN